MKHLFQLLPFLLLALPLQAADITASAATRAAVVTAIGTAVDGDTVIIPAGTVGDWTTQLVTTKAITIRGSGYSDNGTPDLISDDTWGTIIEDRTGTTDTSVHVFNVADGLACRFSQIQINPISVHTSGASNGAVRFSGISKLQRLDHCKFNDPKIRHVRLATGARGVSDHNWHHYSASYQPYLVRNGNIVSGSVNGNASWEAVTGLGTDNAWYIENNYFTQTALNNNYVGVVDSWEGGRYVFRNNSGTVDGSSSSLGFHFSNHGTESAQNLRGGRLIEAYRNTFTSANNHSRVVEFRSGTGVVWNNTITMPGTTQVQLSVYRNDGSTDPWWGDADGTWAWDTPDLSDGAGTPGGAGDGVFETGTSTAGGVGVVTDSSKAWTVDQWKQYNLRLYSNFTASSGTATACTVSGAGWTVNQFAGWIFTKTSGNLKTKISSNTSDTITFNSSYYRPDMTGGGAFQVSMSGRISSNTADTLSLSSQHDGETTFPATSLYELRRVTFALDQAGAGISLAYSPRSKPPHQTFGQVREPIYTWGNTISGSPFVASTGYYPIQENRDYYNYTAAFDGTVGMGSGTLAARPATCTTGVGYWATDQGEWDSTNGATPDGQLYVATATNTWGLHYKPYTYPHPLVSAAPATDTTAPTLFSATIENNGTTVSLVFSENVTGVNAAHYTMSSGSLSAAAGAGPSWTMTLSPVALGTDAARTIAYTAGTTVDTATTPNALANFAGATVNNTSIQSSLSIPRRLRLTSALGAQMTR